MKFHDYMKHSEYFLLKIFRFFLKKKKLIELQSYRIILLNYGDYSFELSRFEYKINAKESLRELVKTVDFFSEIFCRSATVLQHHYHVHILTQ